MRHITLLIITLVGALLLAACAQRPPTAEELVQRMEAAYAATNDAHATVVFEGTTPDHTGRLVVEGWTRKTGATDAAGKPIGQVRMEVREASDPALVGSLVVSDGTTFWFYRPASNTVVTGPVSAMRDSAADTPAGAAFTLRDLLGRGLEAVDLEVLGAEQVAGRSAWKVRVTPKPETQAQLPLQGVVEGTLWVDTELALPLKVALDAADFGQGVVEVRQIETNIGIGADRFSFTPPPGAKVAPIEELTAQKQVRRAASLEAARAAVGFTLREPGYLPDGMKLVEVQVIGDTTVIQNFAGSNGGLSLVQSTVDVGHDREPPVGSQVREVTVRGVAGRLISDANGQGSLLRWQEGDRRYVIAGTITAEEALRVAEGLK